MPVISTIISRARIKVPAGTSLHLVPSALASPVADTHIEVPIEIPDGYELRVFEPDAVECDPARNSTMPIRF